MTATYSSLARWRISSLGFMMSSMSRLQYNIINTLQKMIFQASLLTGAKHSAFLTNQVADTNETKHSNRTVDRNGSS